MAIQEEVEEIVKLKMEEMKSVMDAAKQEVDAAKRDVKQKVEAAEQQAEQRMLSLTQNLLDAGRYDDLRRITQEKEHLEKMLEEYGI